MGGKVIALSSVLSMTGILSEIKSLVSRSSLSYDPNLFISAFFIYIFRTFKNSEQAEINHQ